MWLVYIFSSTKDDINGMFRLPGEIISRLEGTAECSVITTIFSIAKKGKTWLTGYSWHSSKAARPNKAGTEENLHLYVLGLAVRLCPTTVLVLSLRTAGLSFSKTVSSGLLSEAPSVSLWKTALHWWANSSQPQLGAILGGGLWGCRTVKAMLLSEEAAASFLPSLTLTFHLCVWRTSVWDPGWHSSCFRAMRESCGQGPQLIELYVECGRWVASASWRLEWAGPSATASARASLCSLFQEEDFQRVRKDSCLVTCVTSASRAGEENSRMFSWALVSLLHEN